MSDQDLSVAAGPDDLMDPNADGPSGAGSPASLPFLLGNLQVAAHGNQLSITVDITNTSDQSFEPGSTVFDVGTVGRGETGQNNRSALVNMAAIRPGLEMHSVHTDELDPGEYDVVLLVTDHSGAPLSNALSATVVQAGRPVEGGHFYREPRALHLGLAISGVEHVHGGEGEYRTHYTLTNHGREDVPPGLEMNITAMSELGSVVAQDYHLQSHIAPGASLPAYLTLTLQEGAWTVSVTAFMSDGDSFQTAAEDTWTVHIGENGSVLSSVPAAVAGAG